MNAKMKKQELGMTINMLTELNGHVMDKLKEHMDNLDYSELSVCDMASVCASIAQSIKTMAMVTDICATDLDKTEEYVTKKTVKTTQHVMEDMMDIIKSEGGNIRFCGVSEDDDDDDDDVEIPDISKLASEENIQEFAKEFKLNKKETDVLRKIIKSNGEPDLTDNEKAIEEKIAKKLGL